MRCGKLHSTPKAALSRLRLLRIKGLKHGMFGGFLQNTSVFLTPRIGAWPNWSKTLGHQSLLPGMELTKQHIMSSRCHAKPRCWANIFGSKYNSFLRVSTLNADMRGSPFASHLFQAFRDFDNLYIDVAVGKLTRRQHTGQACTNNTYI